MKDRTAQLLSPPKHFHDLGKVRERIRKKIAAVLEEELAAALGAGDGERVETRRGYRHGTAKPRRLVTGTERP